jgi:hypothetical protein
MISSGGMTGRIAAFLPVPVETERGVLAVLTADERARLGKVLSGLG